MAIASARGISSTRGVSSRASALVLTGILLRAEAGKLHLAATDMELASPVLARLGMHATAYVVTGRISNGDPSFLTWPLLHALERRGIEIGSHTVAHRDMTTLSDQGMLEDLTSSRRALERELGHPVPWLAYPFGRYDDRVERLARRAGYVIAVTTRAGALQEARRPLALRRLRVLDSTSVRGLAALLDASARVGRSTG